jgi:nucleotide-binding universal stress UspA family protein
MGIRPDARGAAGGASWIARPSERRRTMITERNRNAHARGTPTTARRGAEAHRFKHEDGTAAPIVAAVDDTPAGTADAEAAVRLARDLRVPVVFVYVRRGPWSWLGEPYYQRRLDAEMRRGGSALGRAMAIARRANVRATNEELAGKAARRVVEFARMRGARLVVLGARRGWLRRSVSRAALKSADRPVLVTPGKSIHGA